MATYANLVGQRGVLSGTTVTLTVGTTATGHRDFAQTVVDGDLTIGDEVYVLLTDATEQQLLWRAQYTDATTLTRATLLTTVGTIIDGSAMDVRLVAPAEAYAGDGTAPHTHPLADVVDKGTAAYKDIPTTGDAAADEVVLGNDTRLASAGEYLDTLTYDPTGVADNAFDIANQTGSLDAGTFL